MKKFLTLIMVVTLSLGLFSTVAKAFDHDDYAQANITLDEATLVTTQQNGSKTFEVKGSVAVLFTIRESYDVYFHYTVDNGLSWNEVLLPFDRYNYLLFMLDKRHFIYIIDGVTGSYKDSVTLQFKLECRTASKSYWDDNHGKLYRLSNKAGAEAPAALGRIPATITENYVEDGIRYIYIMTQKDRDLDTEKPVLCTIFTEELPSEFYFPLTYYPIFYRRAASYVRTYPDGYQLWEYKMTGEYIYGGRYCVSFGPYVSWRLGYGF